MPQVMVPFVVSEIKLATFVAGMEMQLCGKPLRICLTTSP